VFERVEQGVLLGFLLDALAEFVIHWVCIRATAQKRRGSNAGSQRSANSYYVPNTANTQNNKNTYANRHRDVRITLTGVGIRRHHIHENMSESSPHPGQPDDEDGDCEETDLCDGIQDAKDDAVVRPEDDFEF